MNQSQSSDPGRTVEAIIDVCHRLAARGFVAATDGNVSVRLPGGTFLTTRSGVNKGLVTAGDLVEVNAEGFPTGSGAKPSTELAMHLYIYRRRPDVSAVDHAHPLYATGFAAARIPLTAPVFPEVIVALGGVPLAQYATPSTEEVPASMAPYVERTEAILLSNHGVVTYGPDVLTAYFTMEKVEHTAHVTFVARSLGGEVALTPAEIEKLRKASVAAYGKDFSHKLFSRS
jgi:L-fuculose-phosphate aldolase